MKSHQLSVTECKRLLNTGRIHGSIDELRKEYCIESIEDYCGPGLMVLRKQKYPTFGRIPQMNWMNSIIPNVFSSGQDVSSIATTSTIEEDLQNDEKLTTSTTLSNQNITMECKRSNYNVEELKMPTDSTHQDNYHDPASFRSPQAAKSKRKLQHLQKTSHIFDTPSPGPKREKIKRLRVHLPVDINERTPNPKESINSEIGISPVLGYNKKKPVVMKKRRLDSANPTKVVSISEVLDEMTPELEEIDIVSRHDITPYPVNAETWSKPSILSIDKSSDTSITSNLSSMDEMLQIPSDTSSLWQRLKASIPDIIAEGLAFSNDEDEDENDEVCCGFDLMNVDDDTIPDPHPLTLDFTLTPMSPCSHTTHELPSLPPKKTQPVSTQRRTRSQRKKKLSRGISLSNLTHCSPFACDVHHHDWDRFSSCGRMHGRWSRDLH